MTSEVQTVTTCSRCGVRHIEPGANKGGVPANWLRVTLHAHWGTAGEANHLCPPCVGVFKSALRPATLKAPEETF